MKCCEWSLRPDPGSRKLLGGFAPPIWKIWCSSNWVHLPQSLGWKTKTIPKCRKGLFVRIQICPKTLTKGITPKILLFSEWDWNPKKSYSRNGCGFLGFGGWPKCRKGLWSFEAVYIPSKKLTVIASAGKQMRGKGTSFQPSIFGWPY